MSETLTETFARFAEDAEFRRWSEGRKLDCHFVYANKDDNVWKFTREEWWRIVNRAVQNKGACTLPLSKRVHLQKKIDTDIRNLNEWTVDDWKKELAAI